MQNCKRWRGYVSIELDSTLKIARGRGSNATWTWRRRRSNARYRNADKVRRWGICVAILPPRAFRSVGERTRAESIGVGFANCCGIDSLLLHRVLSNCTRWFRENKSNFTYELVRLFLLNGAPLMKAFRVSWRNLRRRKSKLDVSWTLYYNVRLNIQDEYKMDVKRLMSTNDHVTMNKLFVNLEIWN